MIGNRILVATSDSASPQDSPEDISDDSDDSGGGGSSGGGDYDYYFPESIEVSNLDPVPYQVVELDSGDMRLIQQVTLGDVLVSFCLLLVVAVQIGKWIWEGSK